MNQEGKRGREKEILREKRKIERPRKDNRKKAIGMDGKKTIKND